MPAEKETPEGLADRQDVTEGLELEPLPKKARKVSLTASASRVRLDDRKAIEGVMATRQTWQTTAWDQFFECPEIGFTLTFAANLMSKLRLFAAVRPDPEEAPIPVDDPDSGVDADTAKIANEVLSLLRAKQGGQAALVRAASLNLEVCGEGYLHGSTDPDTGEEDWQIRSVDELVTVDGKFAIRAGDKSNKAVALPVDDMIVRLWEPDPRFSRRATCAMRRVLTEAEALLLLSREVIAVAQCADDQTRIMTIGGWRRHDELGVGDLVLTLDHETGLSSWQPVEAVNRYERRGEPMMLMESRGHSSLTTLNHRWPVLHRVQKTGEQRRLWRESRELSSLDMIPCAVPCSDLPIEAKYEDAFVELIGWLWTEGYVRNGQINITQSYAVNEPKCERIRRALTVLYGPARTELRTGHVVRGSRKSTCSFDACDWPVHGHGLCDAHRGQAARGIELRPVRRSKPKPETAERIAVPGWRESSHPDKRCTIFHLNQPASAPLLEVFKRVDDKIISLDFIRALTAAQLELFIETSIAADGSVSRESGSQTLTQNLPERLDAYELACILSGRRVNRTPGVTVFDGREFPKERLHIWMHKNYWPGAASSGAGHRPADPMISDRRTVVEYDGIVWCPTTPNGTWLAQRNGSVYWTGNSRLSAGILIIPSEASLGPPDPTGEDTEDPFDEELEVAMVTPIGQPGHASSVVPMKMRVASEYADKVRLLSLARNLDSSLDQRIEARVLRIARGLNMPVEITRGLMDTKFANALQVRQSEFDSHIEPRAILLVDLFTAGYYHEALLEAGVAPEKAREIFIWFDPTDLIARDDQSEKAKQAYDDLIISATARRKYEGYNESDAPELDEMLRKVALDGAVNSPQIVAQLLRQTETADVEITSATAKEAGSDTASAALTAAARPNATDLGKRLVAIDTELRTRLSAAAEHAIRRVLERAGNRVLRKAGKDKNGEDRLAKRVGDSVPITAATAAIGPAMVAALGLTDEQLLQGAFDSVVSDFGAWVTVSVESALTEVERVLGPLPQSVRDELAVKTATSIPAAQMWLKDELIALAAQRLYGTVVAEGLGEVDALSTIPAYVGRGALAVAGGATATEANGALVDALGLPVPGLATGPIVSTAGHAMGGTVEAYQWEYGAAQREHPFEPHKKLDEKVFTSWSDDALRSTGGFPLVSHMHPGDHKGCICSAIPVWVDSAGDVTPVGE